MSPLKKSAILVSTIAAMTTAAYAQGTSPPNCPPGYQCIPQPNSPAAAGAGVAQADESPWAKLCTKNEQTGNKQICVIQHGGLDAETGIVLGTAAVRTVEGEDKQNLLVGLTTNYSLVLPVGVHIEIDDGEPISLQYIICIGTNCQAQTELTKEIFDNMRKGKQMVVSAITMQQQKLSFPVPLTGFGKAYDGPPADNAKYQEAWRQLVEKSRQRQIELANKLAAQQKSTQQPQLGGPPQQASAPVPAQAPP